MSITAFAVTVTHYKIEPIMVNGKLQFVASIYLISIYWFLIALLSLYQRKKQLGKII